MPSWCPVGLAREGRLNAERRFPCHLCVPCGPGAGGDEGRRGVAASPSWPPTEGWQQLVSMRLPLPSARSLREALPLRHRGPERLSVTAKVTQPVPSVGATRTLT